MLIHSVTIAVPDPEETAAFFRETLDLPVKHVNGAVQVQIRASTLLLDPGEADQNGYYHLAFEVPENTIVAARDLLSSRTAILSAGDNGITTASDAWNSHSIYFNAPGNLNLELIARHRQPNAITTPFAFSDIQYISEVGIPVKDPVQATGQIKAALELESFIPPSDTFAPVGTDDGLLVLVREGRIWYPTEDQTTTTRPLRITIDRAMTAFDLTPTATITGHGSLHEEVTRP